MSPETLEYSPPVQSPTEENLAKIGHEALSLTMAESLGQLRERVEASDDGTADLDRFPVTASELAQSERTQTLTDRISKSLGSAYEQLAQEEPDKVVLHNALLKRTLDLQVAAILDKKQNHEPLAEDITAYLATVGIYHGELLYMDRLISSGCLQESDELKKTALDPIIKAGLTEELVEAARSVHGIVVNRYEAPTYFEDDGVNVNIELSSLIDTKVISAGLGKRVSVDPTEAAFTDMPAHEAATIISSLDLSQASKAALIASKEMSKPYAEGPRATHRRTLAGERALQIILQSQTPSEHIYLAMDDLKEALATLAQADPSLSKSSRDEQFAQIRHSRHIEEDYRQNSQEYMRLDTAIRNILEDESGQFSDEAKQMVRRMNFGRGQAEELLSQGRGDTVLEHLMDFNDLDADILDRAMDACIKKGMVNTAIYALFELPAGVIDLDRLAAQISKSGPADYSRLLQVMFNNEEILSGAAAGSQLGESIRRIRQTTILPELIGNGGTARKLELFVWEQLGHEGADIEAAAAALDLQLREIKSSTNMLEILNDQVLEPVFNSVITERLTQDPATMAETAKNLEDSIKYLQQNTSLLEIFGPNGPGASFSHEIASRLFENPAAFIETAQMLNGIFAREQSLWFLAWQVANIKIGEVGKNVYQLGLKVSEIPTSLPNPTLKNGNLLKQYEELSPKRISEMSTEEKRFYLGLGEELTVQEVEHLTQDGSIDFGNLPDSLKSTIFAHRLMETVVLSRDTGYKREASGRNQEIAETSAWWHSGDLVHATSDPSNLRLILQNGALCGEAIGLSAQRDSYPMNLDTVEVQAEISQLATHGEKLAALYNQSYGQICLVFRRDEESLHAGEEFNGGMNEHHKLVLGGLPSSEVSAILLRDQPSGELIESVKQAVVDNGQYIPVVDSAGRLILSYEEYQKLREDKNYDAVLVESRDSTFRRANSQGGSNEGAEFLVGSERWYVKFSGESPDPIWGEILTDKLYALVKPELIPTTEPALIEGRLTRASKMVEIDDDPVTPVARNAGFVLDCWLANWDAVYNPANLAMSGGVAKRIDNGNGLFFRAQGGRVAEEDFSEVVKEVEVGSDKERLGNGMRQMYPGLSDTEITAQVIELSNLATDEAIDSMVDSVRLTKHDRDYLKTILKGRRDYLVNKFLT